MTSSIHHSSALHMPLDSGAARVSANPFLTDLTGLAQQQELSGGDFADELIAQLSRGLYRSTRHVLLIGERGVGKSTLLRELALQAAQERLPHLSGRRFLAVDCGKIPPGDGKAFLESLTQATAKSAEAVWCLEGVNRLLKSSGLEPRGILQSLLSHAAGNVILVVDRQEFVELMAQHADIIRRLTRVELPEPDTALVDEIVHREAAHCASEFQLEISAEVVTRVINLTGTFLLSEYQPAKSLHLLRRACEDVQFRRTQQGEEIPELQLDHVMTALSDSTGIPLETISGELTSLNIPGTLQAAVAGQDLAIEEVARELQLIKAGFNDPGKPASVMLFAGMTGVGKTELAKRVAELYSSTRLLQTYSMANFTEPHSVSGIIGVPPGYVGYEAGGRLINELIADPYGVFLLDEAEKAHPNVWKPFLNLFDEGWIVDQRGVKAYADRAIFILTTNAGDRNIAQMTRSGRPPEAIAEQVKQALSKVRQERSTQPVFPPAFLARIGRIVVFRPLSEDAMIGIAERVCLRMERQWVQKHQTRLRFSTQLVEWIGRKGHAVNEKAGGREGGRIIRKLVADQIESRIHSTLLANPVLAKESAEVHLKWADVAPDELAADIAPNWEVIAG